MSKLVTCIMMVLLLAVGVLFMPGCKLTPEQVKVVSQNAGLFAAVSWIAYDNPDASAIESVKSVLDVIKEKAIDVEAGKTYTEVVYPEIVKVIDAKVKPQDRPLCKAAVLSLLNGIDMLFAMHPEWKESQDIAIGVVEAFVLGANNGLSMNEGHQVMKNARSTAVQRARIYRP